MGDAADQVTAPIWKIYHATSHAGQYIINSRYYGNLLIWQSSLYSSVSLLREAMQLRGRGLEDGDYYDETERNVRTRRPTDGHRTEGSRAMDPGICIPDLLFPLPAHKAELSRRREGTRRV